MPWAAPGTIGERKLTRPLLAAAQAQVIGNLSLGRPVSARAESRSALVGDVRWEARVP